MCLLFTNISTKAKKRCSFNKKITVLGTDHLTFWSTLYFLSDPILTQLNASAWENIFVSDWLVLQMVLVDNFPLQLEFPAVMLEKN
jgi:hypothetical protein